MKKIRVQLNKYEYNAIIDVVNEYRNKQLVKGNTINYLDKLLSKLLKKV